MNTISSLLEFIARFEPVGSIKMYAGSSAPNNWLFCDGSAVSRTTYSVLFNAIGTTFGAGDGSTTFNLPDLRGRTPIGAGTGTATDATAHTLGSTGGAETHKLTTNEMPSHHHTFGLSGNQYVPSGSYFSVKVSDTSSNTSNVGGDQAHNNMQPYTAVNFIIFAGA